MKKIYKARVFERTYNANSPLVELTINNTKKNIHLIQEPYLDYLLDDVLSAKKKNKRITIECNVCGKHIRSDFYVLINSKEFDTTIKERQVIYSDKVFCSMECHKLDKLKE